MRNILPASLEQGRVREGIFASDASYRLNGVFFVIGPCSDRLKIVASSASMGWEHVSVSLVDRCPKWQEMSFVKGLFWDDEEAVMQLHPPKSDHVDYHPHCLHLWRPVEIELPLPPSILVGPESKKHGCMHFSAGLFAFQLGLSVRASAGASSSRLSSRSCCTGSGFAERDSARAPF
jgi:hypothetical protein